jgi:CheY-like chemotaxis protein
LKREDNHEISEESSVEVMPMSNDEEGQMLKKFDVIFIDLELGVDGFETARRIRDIEKTKLATSNTTAAVSLHHVIIGITMNNDHDTIELASEAGFDSFLPQSFDLQKVMATLKETELSRH